MCDFSLYLANKCSCVTIFTAQVAYIRDESVGTEIACISSNFKILQHVTSCEIFTHNSCELFTDKRKLDSLTKKERKASYIY